MGAGTVASLDRLGFPVLDARTSLQLKPSADVPDERFKGQALDALDRLGQVVATFENEPGNANLFAERFPGAHHVLLDTVCAPDPPALRPEVHRIPDFRVCG